MTDNKDGKGIEACNIGNDCTYDADAGTWSGTCDLNYTTQEATCGGTLPSNAIQNGSAKFTQKSSTGGAPWIPASMTWEYSTIAGECKFICKENFTWNTTTHVCEPKTETKDCDPLPENADWNTTTGSSYLQTWDGTNRGPKYETEHDPAPEACKFTCVEHHERKNGKCEKINYKCEGTVPEKATLCPDSDQNMISHTGNNLVDTCDPANKCEYICNEGYEADSGVCKLLPGRCEKVDDCNIAEETCEDYVPEEGEPENQPGICRNKFVNPAVFYIPEDGSTIDRVNWFTSQAISLSS